MEKTHYQELIRLDNEEILVDQLIAQPIIKLNDLGYKTIYSCSGHQLDSDGKQFLADYGYVAFKKSYSPYHHGYKNSKPKDDEKNGIHYYWDNNVENNNEKMDSFSLQFKIEHPNFDNISIANFLLYNWVMRMEPLK